jgi:hypothetical protein
VTRVELPMAEFVCSREALAGSDTVTVDQDRGDVLAHQQQAVHRTLAEWLPEDGDTHVLHEVEDLADRVHTEVKLVPQALRRIAPFIDVAHRY